MQLLTLIARRSWRALLLAVVTGLACGLTAAALIAVINEDLAGFEGLESSHIWQFLGLTLLVVVTRTVADISLLELGQSAVNDMRLHLSNQLVDTSYRKLQMLGKHRLLAMLTDDSQVISQAVEQVPILLVNAGILFACLGYLGWLSMPMLGLTLVLLVVGLAVFKLPESRALAAISKARDGKDKLFDQYRLLTDGTKELQLNEHRRRQFFRHQLEPTSLEYKKDFVRGMSIYAVALNWGNGLFYLLIGAVLYAGPQLFQLDMVLVTGYVLTILYMITPLSELINALPILGRASISLNKIKALEGELNTVPSQQGAADTSVLTQISTQASADRGKLEEEPSSVDTLQLQGVTHTYYREREDGHFTLGPVDLTLNSGEIIFITGGNGGGKTSLAMLLTGLYQPEGGKVCLNKVLSSGEENFRFRQHFSAVFTDFCLFEHLLQDDSEQALADKAQEYLIHLQLDHKVAIKDGKLSTLELSTGQRKRLALLASYLEDRPCYLFDEWAADQDPLFKRFFYMQILPDLKVRQKMVIAITHDDAYFHLADKVLRVDQGQVQELQYVVKDEPLATLTS
ncbi:cyclic peptide export ABC transporter [Oceanospirillum beijerinckii]|uniref:cyclic peptide export ABC transporter n=1 Tax=Oceanospirillum beijerinckii TaxID=64976 RepID=UPI00048685FE|nr:cyclic peptide export ABC transporter [Oceanospirillum beijerinckii]